MRRNILEHIETPRKKLQGFAALPPKRRIEIARQSSPRAAFPLPSHCVASRFHGILRVTEKFNAFIALIEV